MAKAEKVNIFASFARIREIKAEIKDLEAEEDLLQDLLKRTIPSGTVLDGVQHTSFMKNSISYAQYATFLIDKFVPKTKQAIASSMVAQFTNTSEQHALKEEK